MRHEGEQHRVVTYQEEGRDTFAAYVGVFRNVKKEQDSLIHWANLRGFDSRDEALDAAMGTVWDVLSNEERR